MVRQSFVPCLEWHVPLLASDKKGKAEAEAILWLLAGANGLTTLSIFLSF